VLYVGVDAHKANSHLTVMDEAGKILKRKQIPSSPAGLRQVLGCYDQPIKAVLEASYSWGLMYDWLDELVDEVVLAHPAKVKAIADARIKTDTIDSATLAHLLRTNLIPTAYAPSKDIRAAKRALRQRMFFVRVQTMVKNRIHALLSQHMLDAPDVSDLFGKAGRQWLAEVPLPDSDRHVLDSDLALLEVLQRHIAASNDLLKALSAGDEPVRWLASLPGIGDFYSVLIRYEIGDIKRFHTAKRFVSHTGLVPSTYASGPRLVHGRLIKHGNKWLRWAFIEAVTPAIRHSAFLRRHYQRLKTRRGTKDARVSTARKLAELAWIVWRESRCYEER
jgi:transposase